MGRTMSVWMVGSGLPMILFGLTAFFSLLMRNLTQRQLEVAILIFAAPAAAVFGFLLMWVSAWLTVTPVRAVRAALQQVEDGNLDAKIGGVRQHRTRRVAARLQLDGRRPS